MGMPCDTHRGSLPYNLFYSICFIFFCLLCFSVLLPLLLPLSFCLSLCPVQLSLSLSLPLSLSSPLVITFSPVFVHHLSLSLCLWLSLLYFFFLSISLSLFLSTVSPSCFLYPSSLLGRSGQLVKRKKRRRGEDREWEREKEREREEEIEREKQADEKTVRVMILSGKRNDVRAVRQGEDMGEWQSSSMKSYIFCFFVFHLPLLSLLSPPARRQQKKPKHCRRFKGGGSSLSSSGSPQVLSCCHLCLPSSPLLECLFPLFAPETNKQPWEK